MHHHNITTVTVNESADAAAAHWRLLNIIPFVENAVQQFCNNMAFSSGRFCYAKFLENHFHVEVADD